jgi:hypothetical protein
MKHLREVYAAFNWIGPNGPMPNLAIPNIVNLASVSTNINIDPGQRYMSDIWHYQLMWANQLKATNFKVTSTASLSDTDTFIMPIMLDHSRPMEYHFNPEHGILEQGCTTHQTLEKIRHGNGYIVIDFSIEAFMYDHQLSAMHTYFRDHAHIPANKVIYITGTGNYEEIYSDYCARHNVQERFKILDHFPCTQNLATDAFFNHHPEPEYCTNIMPEKTFLSFNRRPRQHRIILAMLFNKRGLLDNSLFSLPLELFGISTIDSINYQMLKPHGLDKHDVDSLFSQMPLTIDGAQPHLNEMVYDGNMDMHKYYEKTLVSVCTETSFHSNIMAITEKVIKPIKYKHPFVLLGARGILAKLKSFGYRTFDAWWDESYDDIEDHVERLEKIVEVCEYINSWDEQKIMNFKQEVKEILDHNYSVFIGNPISPMFSRLYKHVLKGAA